MVLSIEYHCPSSQNVQKVRLRLSVSLIFTANPSGSYIYSSNYCGGCRISQLEKGLGHRSQRWGVNLLLPPANEVWGKVIFLHLFVILFTGGGMCGCLGGRGACVVAQGGMRGCSGGACVVAPEGGGMCGCSWGGPAWLLPGGHASLLWGGRGVGGHAWDTTRYGDTVNERAVRILLECILVGAPCPKVGC